MKPRVEEAIILTHGITMLNGIPLAPHPKLLLPIGNRLLLDYQAAVFADAGVKRLIIAVNTQDAESVERIRKSSRLLPLEVECVVQEEPRGTAGTLKLLENSIKGDGFWVLNGNLLLRTDLRHMLAHHREKHYWATLAAVAVELPSWELENIQTDADGTVKTVERMPRTSDSAFNLRPIGLYLFDRAVLAEIPSEGYFDIKEQLFALLYSRSIPTGIWKTRDYARNIMTLDGYRAANWDVLFGHLPLPAPHCCTLPQEEVRPSSIAPSAVMVDPIGMDGQVDIGERAVIIGPTCIGDRCVIGRRAVLNDCILFPGSRVGPEAQLNNCILGEGAVVEGGADLREAVVLRKSNGGQEIIPFGSGASSLARMRPERGDLIGLERPYPLWKRAFDLAFSLAALVAAAPLMALVAAAIRADSPGPVIFSQRRCGRHGRVFKMYKFRTMVQDAEEIKAQIENLNEVDGPTFKITEDPRVTRVGRWLRSSNLDELPQLWNVLKGDMALIGPRPLSMSEMRLNPRWRDLRLSVRPGLTGLWQVESKSKTSFADWIRYDIQYVCNFSPWMDAKILAKSFRDFFFGLTRLAGRLVGLGSSDSQSHNGVNGTPGTGRTPDLPRLQRFSIKNDECQRSEPPTKIECLERGK